MHVINLKTNLIRINKEYPMVITEIKNKTISFDEDTNKIIEDLKGRKNYDNKYRM